MTNAHIVYPGGWVRTSLLTKKFRISEPACELCRRATCGPFWFQLEREAVRCCRCQGEDDLRRDAETHPTGL